MSFVVSVVNGGSIVRNHVASGGDLRLQAFDHGRYVLSQSGGLAVLGNVTATRVGKSLFVSLDTEDALLVIEDFFSRQARLHGVDAEGALRDYAFVAAGFEQGVSGLIDGSKTVLALAATLPEMKFSSLPVLDASVPQAPEGTPELAATSGGVALGEESEASAVIETSSASSAQAEPVVELAAQAAQTKNDAPAADVVAPVDQLDGPVAEVIATGEDTIAAHVDAPAVETLETVATLEAGAEVADHQAALIDEAAAAPMVSESAAEAMVAGVAKPVVASVIDDQGAKRGVVENGGYTDDSRPQITGTAGVGVRVHLYDGNELIGRVLVGSSGEWSFVPRLPMVNGRHAISIIHEHPDGDVSDVSEPYIIHVDKVAPDAPLMSDMVDNEGDITGSVSNGGVTDDNRPTLSGTAEPHGEVVIYDK